MSKTGIFSVVLRTLGLIVLLFSAWWWVGLAGFLLLTVIRERDVGRIPAVLIYSNRVRMAVEMIFLFVGAWGISTLPFLSENDRIVVMYVAIGLAAVSLLWRPLHILLMLICYSVRRAVRGY